MLVSVLLRSSSLGSIENRASLAIAAWRSANRSSSKETPGFSLLDALRQKTTSSNVG